MDGGSRIRVACPAKVNLFLEVISRRPDGFHEVRTVLRTVALSDTLEAERGGGGIRLEVEGADLPAGRGNLVVRAAETFSARFGREEGVGIRLRKRIPAAGGLGGGSSDAAGTLVALRDLFRPDLSGEDLLPAAAAVGSDVPFFLLALLAGRDAGGEDPGGGTALARGRGESVAFVRGPRPGHLVLGTPPFGVATGAVYEAVRAPSRPRSPEELLRRLPGAELAALGPFLGNRLEEAALRVEPRLAGIREALAAALAPEEPLLLSGAGSTFFAAVAGEERAREVARRWNAQGMVRAAAVGHPAPGGAS